MLPRHGGIASAGGQVLAYPYRRGDSLGGGHGVFVFPYRITVVDLDVMSSVRSALGARACQIRAETKGLGCPPPVAIQVSGPSSPASPAVYKRLLTKRRPSGAGVTVLSHTPSRPGRDGARLRGGKRAAPGLRPLTCAVIFCGLSCAPSCVLLSPGGG